MKLLALDTSTELLTVAVARDAEQAAPRLWQHSGPGGAQTSAQLIGVIQRLMQAAGLSYAELDAIVFGRGPGSFSGLRSACAVAQGLGLGAGVPLLPVDTLLAVAEEARAQHAAARAHWRVLAVLDARMNECYAAPYDYTQGHWQQQAGFALCQPAQVWAQAQHYDALVGNVFGPAGADPAALQAASVTVPRDLPLPPCWSAAPTASAMLRLAPALLKVTPALPAAAALPLYVRDKVALTTLEQQAAKALAP